MEPSRVRRCHSRGRLKDRIERKWSECPCENDVGRLSSGIGARRKRINVSTKFVLEIMLLYSLIVLNIRMKTKCKKRFFPSVDPTTMMNVA